MKQWLAALVVLAVAGCGAPVCPAGTPMTVFTLYMGEAVSGRGDVSDAEWHRFLDDVVTVNLPAGYTVFDARGAWRSPASGRTVSEATKVLVVAMPPGPAGVAAVNRVREAYQVRFQQQLVGMTVASGCGDF